MMCNRSHIVHRFSFVLLCLVIFPCLLCVSQIAQAKPVCNLNLSDTHIDFGKQTRATLLPISPGERSWGKRVVWVTAVCEQPQMMKLRLHGMAEAGGVRFGEKSGDGRFTLRVFNPRVDEQAVNLIQPSSGKTVVGNEPMALALEDEIQFGMGKGRRLSVQLEMDVRASDQVSKINRSKKFSGTAQLELVTQ